MQKRMRELLLGCLFVFLLVIVLAGCSKTSPLQEAMANYSRMVEGNIPDDIRLIIYYLDPSILTRAPLSEDDLKTFPGVEMITVEPEELEAHWTLLKALDPSALQPVKEKTYINARVYYVFEVGTDSVLEVVISNIHGNVFINGVEVEDHPVFYEMIIPYLTQEDRTVLGI